MTLDERMKIVQDLIKDRLDIMDSKGKAYAGEEQPDALANFKKNAERLGMTKFQVWAIYFFKHINAIENALRKNPENPVDDSEGLKGRVMDAINYLELLWCLLEEDVHI